MTTIHSPISPDADQFEATVHWTGDEPMLPGRLYQMSIGTMTIAASFAHPKYKQGDTPDSHLAARLLARGETGVCNVSLAHNVPCSESAPHDFVLIEASTGAQLGHGQLHFALRRAYNIQWQAVDINRAARAAMKQQQPRLIWFTGLSGAGKSTIANLVEKRLHALGRHTYLLDGDNVRHGINRDLGFADADRVENIRRVAEIARLMLDAGLIVLVAFISPFRAERRMARNLVAPNEFVEVFVDTPLTLAEARDPKGLYKKARDGQLKNFTGIDSPYEAPEHAEIRIDTRKCTAEEATAQIVAYLDSEPDRY